MNKNHQILVSWIEKSQDNYRLGRKLLNWAVGTKMGGLGLSDLPDTALMADLSEGLGDMFEDFRNDPSESMAQNLIDTAKEYALEVRGEAFEEVGL